MKKIPPFLFQVPTRSSGANIQELNTSQAPGTAWLTSSLAYKVIRNIRGEPRVHSLNIGYMRGGIMREQN